MDDILKLTITKTKDKRNHYIKIYLNSKLIQQREHDSRRSYDVVDAAKEMLDMSKAHAETGEVLK